MSQIKRLEKFHCDTFEETNGGFSISLSAETTEKITHLAWSLYFALSSNKGA
jgi:hypothetical protein